MTEVTLLNAKTNTTKTWPSMTECALELGCSMVNVGYLIHGKNKSIMNGEWKLPSVKKEKKAGRAKKSVDDLVMKGYVSIKVDLIPLDLPYATPINEGNKKTLRDFLYGKHMKYLTSKRSLGCLVDLIRNTKYTDIKEFFHKEYLPQYGEKYFDARNKFFNRIRTERNIPSSIITDDEILEYFEHDTIISSWGGVKNGDIAIKAVANYKNVSFAYASSKMDTKGIDAYIGGRKVQVKSIKGISWAYDSDMYIYYDPETNLVWFNKAYFDKVM